MATDNTTNPLVKSAIKVLATDSTQAAYTYSASGYYSSMSANVGSVPCSNGQVAVITFVGIGADNDTYTCEIWARTEVADSDGNASGAFKLDSVGVATVTLSTGTGVSGNTIIPSTYRVADTIAWVPATTATTPTGNYSDLAGALGYTTGTASSPANNTPASLILPCIGEATALVFDFKKAGTTTGMNAFAQINTV